MEMKELSMDEMEQVSGGMRRPVNTGTEHNAIFRTAPRKNASVICYIHNGEIVNTIGRELVWDPESGRNFIEVAYNGMTGWIAAFIVGLE